jgi:hypothetical protein
MIRSKAAAGKRAALGIAFAAMRAAAIAGLALAAWAGVGTGAAYENAAGGRPLATEQASTSDVAPLYPGATGDAIIEITNRNPDPLRITGVSLNGSDADITADPSHPGCTTTGVSFHDQTGLSIDVPAKSGGTEGRTRVRLAGAVSMSNASLDDCQGATFAIPVSLTSASN